MTISYLAEARDAEVHAWDPQLQWQFFNKKQKGTDMSINGTLQYYSTEQWYI